LKKRHHEGVVAKLEARVPVPDLLRDD